MSNLDDLEKVAVESLRDEKLRKQIQLLSEKTNKEIYEQRRHLIGKVLTIVDASTNDPDQRKAVKDMVNDAFYGPSYWNNISVWFEAFARANSLSRLYDNETLLSPNSQMKWDDKNPILAEFKNI